MSIEYKMLVSLFCLTTLYHCLPAEKQCCCLFFVFYFHPLFLVCTLLWNFINKIGCQWAHTSMVHYTTDDDEGKEDEDAFRLQIIARENEP